MMMMNMMKVSKKYFRRKPKKSTIEDPRAEAHARRRPTGEELFRFVFKTRGKPLSLVGPSAKD